jgi:integrase/recombinase XerD
MYNGCGSPAPCVFSIACGHPLTRFGIHAQVERYTYKVRVPSLAEKIGPHTPLALVSASVDIIPTCAWLGHVSLDTTNIYAEMDWEMKAKAPPRVKLPM